jgi:hypothetical protein
MHRRTFTMNGSFRLSRMSSLCPVVAGLLFMLSALAPGAAQAQTPSPLQEWQ